MKWRRAVLYVYFALSVIWASLVAYGAFTTWRTYARFNFYHQISPPQWLEFAIQALFPFALLVLAYGIRWIARWLRRKTTDARLFE